MSRDKKKSYPKSKSSKFAAYFKHIIYEKKYQTIELFNSLQSFNNFQEIEAVSKLFTNPSNPFHKYIFGNTFAKSYSEIRSKRYFAFTDDLDRDFHWMSLSIIRYSKEINQFISDSIEFQRAFLLGKYDQANDILKKIINNCGYSLWYLEKEFLLLESALGLEANKQLLSDIVGDDSTSLLLQIIADFLSLRCESKISVENYRNRLLRETNLEEEYTYIINYFLYRLDRITSDLSKVATHVTYLEGYSPIVDRYLTFLNLCQSCSIEGNIEQQEIIKKNIIRLKGYINDSRLESLLQFYEPSKTLYWDSFSDEIFSILDAYTNGRYEISANNCSLLLSKYPDVFELYSIYLHSLGYLGKDFLQVLPKNSIAANILEHMNIIIRGEKTWQGSIDSIQKLALILWRDPLAYQLNDLYIQETVPSSGKQFQKLALLNSLIFNPRFAYIYDDPNKSKLFLDQIRLNLKEKSSTLLLMEVMTTTSVDKEEVVLPDSIPNLRRQIYSAVFFENTSKPLRAINILEPLFEQIIQGNISGSLQLYDRVIRTLFRCYINTNNLIDCTDMIVKAFLCNPLWIMKIPLNQLIDQINETIPPELMRKISYPILYSLFHTKARPIYVALDNFLNSLGLTKPTQLIDLADNFNPKKLRYFFIHVCTFEILACSYHFCSTKELEGERIRICQFLSEIDPENLKSYSEEISSITSSSFIREGMRQIEKSKIFVDDSGIRSSGLTLLKENFDRYIELGSLSNINKLRLIDHRLIQLYMFNENGEIIKETITASGKLDEALKRILGYSTQFLLFKDLFFDIRDRFIASGEHGLDAYLSVRIRHGVLQNQIRSPFEALHLISEKDTATGEYLTNQYWESKFDDISEDDRKAIQKHLGIFSFNVDNLAHKLNKEMIQVKTERKNPGGFFDYTFYESELLEYFLNEFTEINNFDQFLDGVFRILWKRTEENLIRIREAISGEFKDEMYKNINYLEKEIRQLVGPYQEPELLRNIVLCQTKLQYELDDVAQWFNISRSSLVEQFTMNDLLSICIKSINNIFPHKSVHPSFKIQGDIEINGNYFVPFSDIIRNLIENILVHSGMQPEDMRINILAEANGNYLTLIIKNALSQSVRQKDPCNQLQLIHSSLKTTDVSTVIAREGGSGLMKVRKIMIVDLKRKESSINFFYDDNDMFTVKIIMELAGLIK